MEKSVFICKDSLFNVIAVCATEKLAKDSWVFSYHKLFTPTFEHQPATRWVVKSATGHVMGYIDEHSVRTEVDHL